MVASKAATGGDEAVQKKRPIPDVAIQKQYPEKIKTLAVGAAAAAGRSMTDVAKDVGCSTSTLADWMKASKGAEEDAAVQQNRSTFFPEKIKELAVAAVVAGKTSVNVAKDVGCSPMP